MQEYSDRVRVILEKVNDAEDKEDNIKIIVDELNKMGHLYFGHHKLPYRTIDMEDIEDEPIEALTKKQFMKKYKDEMGGSFDLNEDEASFSDAFRHATLIDVDTLRVPPRELWGELAIEFDKFEGSDYVFKWQMIQELPAKLEGTRLVAIHFDTEDTGLLFFPVPGSDPIAEINGNAESNSRSNGSD